MLTIRSYRHFRHLGQPVDDDTVIPWPGSKDEDEDEDEEDENGFREGDTRCIRALQVILAANGWIPSTRVTGMWNSETRSALDKIGYPGSYAADACRIGTELAFRGVPKAPPPSLLPRLPGGDGGIPIWAIGLGIGGLLLIAFLMARR